MSSKFKLDIVTPERKFFSEEVEMVILKTLDGEMGVLKGHTPMVVVVDIGPVKIKKDEQWVEAVLGEGFMEVKRDYVVILTDTAEWPHEIDINRARKAKERAEERLQRQLNQIEFLSSRAALVRAMERLKISKKV